MTEENNVPYLDPQAAIANTDYLETIFNDISKRFESELEHAQGRSAFQIEKFVAGNDFSISSVYKHCLKNAGIMRKELMRTVKEGIENQREFELKWGEDSDRSKPIQWPTRDGGTKNHWYDLDLFEYKSSLNDLAVSIKDKVQQLAFFDEILDQLIKKNGGPITREQFDAEEPIYWQRRLSKQLHDDLISHATGGHGGNIEAARQAAAPVLLPGSKNQIALPPLDLLIPGSPNYAPEKFLEFAQQGMVDTYLDTSAPFVNQVIEQQKAAEQIDYSKDIYDVKTPKNPDDLLSSLGISETNK